MPFKPGYLQYAIDRIFRPAGEFDGRRRLHGTVQEFSTGLKFVPCSVNIASLFNFMHQNNRTVLEIVTLTKYTEIFYVIYLFVCIFLFRSRKPRMASFLDPEGSTIKELNIQRKAINGSQVR